MYNILVCDDDRDIRNALRIYLNGEGYGVLEASNGKEALDKLASDDIHIVLMDIMMPLMDGMTATARIRQESNVPVILLTAKGEDMDKVAGLTVGADDYVTKPFNPLEVIARVKAQLRRYAYLGGIKLQPSKSLRVGDIELDDDAKQVTLCGEPVSFTPTEYEILKLLMQNPGKVFFLEGNIQQDMERRAHRSGGHHSGAHTAYTGKARDRSRQPEIFKGGLGQRL